MCARGCVGSADGEVEERVSDRNSARQPVSRKEIKERGRGASASFWSGEEVQEAHPGTAAGARHGVGNVN